DVFSFDFSMALCLIIPYTRSIILELLPYETLSEIDEITVLALSVLNTFTPNAAPKKPTANIRISRMIIFFPLKFMISTSAILKLLLILQFTIKESLVPMENFIFYKSNCLSHILEYEY